MPVGELLCEENRDCYKGAIKMIGMAMIYWLKEVQWAREQIGKAKTRKEKIRAIEYHKEICKMGRS